MCEVDKAWEPMRRCLSDGTLRLGRRGGGPLELTGPAVAEALESVDEAWLRERYRSTGATPQRPRHRVRGQGVGLRAVTRWLGSQGPDHHSRRPRLRRVTSVRARAVRWRW